MNLFPQHAESLRRHLPLAFRRHPSAALLLAQLLQILLYPATTGSSFGHLALGLAGILVLVMVIWLIRKLTGRLWTTLSLAAAAVLCGIGSVLFDVHLMRVIRAALESALYFYAAWCMIGYILSDRRPTTDELFAAAATFTLIVWAFTQALVLCQLLQPGAFLGAAEAGDPRSWSELMFLSFALFSSTGLGNVVPMTAAARAVGNLEMFAGVMYLAFVLSRLAGQAANHGVKQD